MSYKPSLMRLSTLFWRRDHAGKTVEVPAGAVQPLLTKLSSTFFLPAFSKSMLSLLPSMLSMRP